MAVKPVHVGERIKRREDPRLIRGLATYTDDLKLHGMLHAAFVRSDHAAGRIAKIDAQRALARPGVVGVFTFDELRGKVGPAPCTAILPGMNHVPYPLLADGRVLYVGQPVAVVVAKDRYLARDAALDVEVEIDARPRSRTSRPRSQRARRRSTTSWPRTCAGTSRPSRTPSSSDAFARPTARSRCAS